VLDLIQMCVFGVVWTITARFVVGIACSVRLCMVVTYKRAALTVRRRACVWSSPRSASAQRRVGP
jgi:hypothetical protein